MRLRRLAVAAIPLMLLAACSTDTLTGPEAEGHTRANQVGTEGGSTVTASPQLGSGALLEPSATDGVDGVEGINASPQLGSGALFEPIAPDGTN